MSVDPSIDPAALAALREADLAKVEAQLAAKNPHAGDMNLPPALTDDGGMGA